LQEKLAPLEVYPVRCRFGYLIGGFSFSAFAIESMTLVYSIYFFMIKPIAVFFAQVKNELGYKKDR